MREQVPRFVASFPEGARIVNVGSAGLRHGPSVLNVDLAADYGVDIVGDATQLPFQDESLDGFISRRVLEHVCKPDRAVAEMRRALKPGGRVWCEIPFLQGYHPTPTDFQRYTKAGMADLFDQFTVVELGVASGPSSAMSWMLREYLAILFSFNNPHLYKIGERVFSWLTQPVKLLDFFLVRNRFAPQIASSFYIIAQKDGAAAG
jgi:SAM-dependent methyltransferase